jgi:hypothetical protein
MSADRRNQRSSRMRRTNGEQATAMMLTTPPTMNVVWVPET